MLVLVSVFFCSFTWSVVPEITSGTTGETRFGTGFECFLCGSTGQISGSTGPALSGGTGQRAPVVPGARVAWAFCRSVVPVLLVR